MRKLRLAVIGCGGFVHYHIRTVCEKLPAIRIVGLADPLPSNAQRLITERGLDPDTPVYTRHLRMLREVRPDAVIVSSPHTLHFRHCWDALSTGAHVLVEKPMVTNADHARRLVRLAKQRRRVLQIAVQGTYTDTFAYARQLIATGVIGELQLATGILAQSWLEGSRGKWRQDPALSGGGQLYDSTAHVLSAMVFLVNSPISAVFCWTDNKGVRVDINAVGVIRFANGCLATITSGGNCPAWKSHLTIQGSKAIMEVGAHGGNFSVTATGIKEPITAPPEGFKLRTVSPVENFHDAVRGRAQPRCPGRIGIILADLMDGLYASAETGRPVKITRRLPPE
jgi:predicted dehydrogenase